MDNTGWLGVLGDKLATHSSSTAVEDEADPCCKPPGWGPGIPPLLCGPFAPSAHPLCSPAALELFPERCRCWGQAVDCTAQDLSAVPWVSPNVTRL